MIGHRFIRHLFNSKWKFALILPVLIGLIFILMGILLSNIRWVFIRLGTVVLMAEIAFIFLKVMLPRPKASSRAFRDDYAHPRGVISNLPTMTSRLFGREEELKTLDAAWGTPETGTSINIVSVVGSNGAGKTTLLRTISGLIHPASGEIWFEGARTDSLKPHFIAQKRLIQVPEGKQLWPNLTVSEHLEVGSYTDEAKKYRDESLTLVMEHFPVLGKKKDVQAQTLSGGEQQMLATARGLMSRPKLLMLDEPSLGLAPLLVNAVFAVIENLNKRGTSILLVEQNLHEALNISNRGYVLETGSVSMEGPSKELLSTGELKQAYLGI